MTNARERCKQLFRQFAADAESGDRLAQITFDLLVLAYEAGASEALMRDTVARMGWDRPAPLSAGGRDC